MQVLFGLTGLVIVGFTTLDVVWITLGRGGGPVTDRISQWIWKTVFYNHKSNKFHRLLSTTGFIVVLIIISLWLFLLWIGWSLVFNLDEYAVITSRESKPADLVGRFYFVGYTLWTLGMGDYVPNGAVWQVATIFASIQGFSLIVLTITYLISVVSAVNEKRQVSAYISSLGKAPDEIILNVWNGSNCRILKQHLMRLVPLIIKLAQRYTAYPVLYYFYTSCRRDSVTLNIAVLDETLTIMKHGLKHKDHLDPVVLQSTHYAISNVLKAVERNFIMPVTEPPPIPSLNRLRSGGIPTISDESFQAAVESLDERRKLLLTFIHNGGWSWDDVISFSDGK